MSTRILVLADDLTGALDTGVQFTAAGRQTVVIPTFEKAGGLDEVVAQAQESAGGGGPEGGQTGDPARAGRADPGRAAGGQAGDSTRAAEAAGGHTGNVAGGASARAADGGVQAGLSHERADTPIAVVVNTESRHISADIAACRVRELVARARRANIHQFYKKTDSTLRGNVAAELRALHEAAGGKPLFFVPAYPDTGRTTRESIHYVDGVPLAETSFAGDVRGGVRESNVLRLLGGPDETVQAGPPPAQLRKEGAQRPGIIVLDAETNEDLETIAEYLAETSQLALTAGPGGFAKYLARLAGGRQTGQAPGNAADAPQAASAGNAGAKRASPARSHAEGALPTLVICGSLHSASTEQLERARRAGLRGVTLAEPSGEPGGEGDKEGGGAAETAAGGDRAAPGPEGEIIPGPRDPATPADPAAGGPGGETSERPRDPATPADPAGPGPDDETGAGPDPADRGAQLARILERDGRAFLRTAPPAGSAPGPGAAAGASAPGGRGTGRSTGGGTGGSGASEAAGADAATTRHGASGASEAAGADAATTRHGASGASGAAGADAATTRHGASGTSEAADADAATAEAVLSQISGVARAAVEQSGACNLVIFGGDTALETVRELGIARIYPQFEISAGVVRSVGVASAGDGADAPDAGHAPDAGGGRPAPDSRPAPDAPQVACSPDAGGGRAAAPRPPATHPRRFNLVTKAGGFGGPDVLAEIFDTLSSTGDKEQRT